MSRSADPHRDNYCNKDGLIPSLLNIRELCRPAVRTTLSCSAGSVLGMKNCTPSASERYQSTSMTKAQEAGRISQVGEQMRDNVSNDLIFDAAMQLHESLEAGVVVASAIELLPSIVETDS